MKTWLISGLLTLCLLIQPVTALAATTTVQGTTTTQTTGQAVKTTATQTTAIENRTTGTAPAVTTTEAIPPDPLERENDLWLLLIPALAVVTVCLSARPWRTN